MCELGTKLRQRSNFTCTNWYMHVEIPLACELMIKLLANSIDEKGTLNVCYDAVANR